MRARQDSVALAVLGLVVAIAYVPVLGRGFTSEDFLILRYLADGDRWAKLLEQIRGPWLGIPAVRFYRPVSTLFFAGEGMLFGDRPWLFGLVHATLHAVNAGLVYGLVRRLRPALGRSAAVAVAAAFALHPLHPNAVLFAASFATLLGALFSLVALLAWLGPAGQPRRISTAVALAAYGLALGSYELAAVLPAVVVVVDLMLRDEPTPPWRTRLAGWSWWWGGLALYLVFRRLLFGEVVGGYPQGAEWLRHLELGPRLQSIVRSLAVLLWPDWRASGAARRLAVVGVALAVAGLLAAARRRRDPGGGRAMAVALAWILLFLAPFGWAAVIPGTGRYAYLAAAGAAWLMVEAVRQLGLWARPRLALGAVAALVALVWLPLLFAVQAAYSTASALAARSRESLSALLRERPEPEVFCLGYPLHVCDADGTPLAAVFHYGLADSVRRPFGEVSGRIYALTEGVVEDLAPLSARGRALALLRWQVPGGGWRRERMPAAENPDAHLAVQGPAEDAVWSVEASAIQVARAPDIEYSTVVLAEGNAHREPLSEHGAGPTLPVEFLATIRHLYGSPVFWWVEGRDRSGRRVTFSVARRLRLAAAPPGRPEPADG